MVCIGGEMTDNLQVLGVVYERCVLKVGQLKTGCSKTGGDCIHTIDGQFFFPVFDNPDNPG